MSKTETGNPKVFCQYMVELITPTEPTDYEADRMLDVVDNTDIERAIAEAIRQVLSPHRITRNLSVRVIR